MFDQLENFDQQLFLTLNGWHVDWLDTPMYLISQAWFWAPLFAYIAYKIFKVYGARSLLVLVLGAGLTVLFCDQTATNGFKHRVKRYRPTHNLLLKDKVHTVESLSGQEYRGGKYSFISGHSTNFFGLAMYFFLWMGSFSANRKKWLWIFAWAALIAYSRIYLGVHYPADLAVGCLFGLFLGKLAFMIVWRVRKSLAAKYPAGFPVAKVV